MEYLYITNNEDETQKIAKNLAGDLKPGDVVLLYGEIGAGKTCFVKGIAETLHINPFKVTSPTFIILNEYKGNIPLYHFDFYRIETMEEIENIGFFDYIESSGISIIEWPEKIEKYIKSEIYKIKIDINSDNTRSIVITKNPDSSRSLH
ncbi:tRNA (adenosine(37)-N6)-threonylcarbamoyltransferase complex ATPase subunit type 1 TsaE [Candidatus Poribacteria bacterium]|nr:tRNA (adenosine(37)-N6)-threonylcarbamoyltransferase complex ATPase subunit type 1 TsaE [Candidatus Poribacteria bacterium]